MGLIAAGPHRTEQSRAGSTLRLVRHGETEWAAEGRYAGHTDLALNAVGVAQAQALASIAYGPYDSVWSSDLQRCVETARLMGVEAEPTPALREFDFGDIEGARWEDLDARIQQGLAEFDGFVAPGGEAVAAFGARIDGFVDGLGSGHHLLVAHGGVIRHLLRRMATDADVRPGSWRDLRLRP